MTTPNFFQLANSELTQDAFIMWLLEWANPKKEKEYTQIDSALHSTAEQFVGLLLTGSPQRIPISSINYKAQENNIDVLALITDTNGNQHAVIIEDKTDTSAHDNQLVRYSKDVKKRYKSWKLHCVYLKTGNESKHSLKKMESAYLNDDWVKKNQPFFRIILREDLLAVFKDCSSQNQIFVDFYENLNRIQQLTDTYKRPPEKNVIVGKWGNTAWQGFFRGLEEKITKSLWDNTHRPVKKNANGTVLSGWEFKMPKQDVVEDGSIRVYLNLCLSKLTLKVLNKSCNAIVLNDVVDLNKMLSKYDIKLKVPKGKTSSLASITRLDGNSFIDENDYAEIDCVVDKLKLLQNFLPELVKHVEIK